MDLRTVIKIIFVLVLVEICVSISGSTIDKQSQGCSIEGIDLSLCLNQKNSSFSIDGACCKVLNKVVRTGFNCLCLLLASNFPILSTPVLLPLSSCFITLPPLTLCKVLAPMPIVFPPNTPNEVHQPLLTPPPLPPPPPPPPENSLQLPINSIQKNNSSTNMGTQPPSSTIERQNSTDKPSPQPTCLSHNKNQASKLSEKYRLWLYYLVLFLSFAL